MPDETFSINIIDPCKEPITFIEATGLLDQEYTITQPAFDYNVATFQIDPSWCPINYFFTITNAVAENAVKFNPGTNTFTFE